MSAVLFGSISSVADTSQLQHEAFNQAFAEHGLDWRWEGEQYREMLQTSGGQGRIAEYARALGQTVDVQAVHDTKSKLFQKSLRGAQLSPRPGVIDTIRAAHAGGWKVGLVTTTSQANVAALLDALAPDIQVGDFDVIVHAGTVGHPKPEPDAYAFAVASLAERPDDCIAIEDNLGGIASARAAGVACVAFPNANTAGHDFGDTSVVDRVDFDALTAADGGRA